MDVIKKYIPVEAPAKVPGSPKMPKSPKTKTPEKKGTHGKRSTPKGSLNTDYKEKMMLAFQKAQNAKDMRETEPNTSILNFISAAEGELSIYIYKL